jgi:transcriptional regulator with XRE-family HTH domain
MEPHPVDIHVGRRLRSRRTILGMSQEEIGEAVGITFQQVQKYERGLNRIGSSRLYEFSCLLGVNVSYFFEDLDKGGDGSIAAGMAEEGASFEYEQLNNKEILTLVRSYYGIKDANVRKKMLSLMKSLAEDNNNDKKVVAEKLATTA